MATVDQNQQKQIDNLIQQNKNQSQSIANLIQMHKNQQAVINELRQRHNALVNWFEQKLPNPDAFPHQNFIV